MESIECLTNAAISAALSAGHLLKKGFGTTFSISSKEGKHNLVTEYDHLSEKQILSFLSSKFPTHNFLAEESGLHEQSQQSICWIIDPLDGTVNFAHGIPIFSVSIAAYFQAEVLCGVIYSPLFDELFVAQKNGGAYLNGSKVQVTPTKELSESLIAFGLPYNTHENPLKLLDQISGMGKLGVPMRRMGSAAIDLAYVASGRFDGFWETYLQPWDYAAGMLLIEEAGGKVTNLQNEKYTTLNAGDIVASNSFIHSSFLTQLNQS